MLSSKTFSPLRNKPFFILVVGSLLANLGNTIQSVGAAWYLTEAGEPADVVALVQTAFNLPIMLLGLPAGAWCDLFDKRRTLLVSLTLMFGVSVALAVLAQSGGAGPVVIIGLTALLACGVAFIIPAVASSVNFVVGRGELAAAVALNILAFNVARSFGPALGGAITSMGGASTAFVVNAAAYLLVIALLWRWRLPVAEVPTQTPVAAAPKRRMVPVMAEGVRFAIASPQIRRILIRAFIFTFTGAAAWAVMPLFASQELGAGSFVYGLLLAALGCGAVLGAASATSFRSRFSAEAIMRGSAILYGIGCLLVALEPGLPAILLLLVAAGSGWVQALSGFAVGGQMWSPRAVVGRITSLVSGVTFGGIAIGSWLWGHFAQVYGISSAIAVSGAAMVLMPLLGLLLPMPDHSGHDEHKSIA